MFKSLLPAIALLLFGILPTTPALACGDYVDGRPLVQIAICLDTSGSMNGLIDAARQKLWAIVNDLATAKPSPKLEIALLSYGNDGYNPENGWVSMLLPFTEDLDLVSERLFSLVTNGGTELVGRVVDKAARDLAWDTHERSLKIILVAGNESADQDAQVSFRDACKKSISGGIMVNSIYCGGATDPDAPLWREVAQLADGHYACIDKDNGTIAIDTPFDAELITLSASLNETYIPFGTRGDWAGSNQISQDVNAAGLGSAAAAERCQTKGGCQYVCATWDLVDALDQGAAKLEDVNSEELPEEMQKMTLAERSSHVDKKRTARAEIKKQIEAVSAKRTAHVTEVLAKQALTGENSFDAAVRTAIRAQAVAKGLRFDEPLVDAGK